MSPSTTTVLPPGTKPSSASRPRRNESEGILPASFKTRFLSPVKRERKPTPGRGTPVSVRSSNLDISPTRSRSVIFFEPSISSALKAESWGQLGDGLQAANSVQYKPRETCDATEPLERLEWHLEEPQPPQRPQPIHTCERLERRLRDLQLSQVTECRERRHVPQTAVGNPKHPERLALVYEIGRASC